MKKIISLILIIIMTASLFSACNEIETVELNERLIIEAIGIDYEDGKYKVTIEGLDSFSAGSDNSSISAQSLTKSYLFEGDTIGMAMNSISVVTGQIPLFSQARVLILGFSTAEEKLSEVLDFFRREYTTRTDILLAVAKNKASDIVSADFGENVSAGNVIQAALTSYKYTGRNVDVPLYKFLNRALNETDSAYCPYIDIKENVYTGKKEVQLSGTAVFNKNGEPSVLTSEMTLAMMIINNDIINADLSIDGDKGTATLEIIDCKTKIKTEIKDGKVNFSIKSVLRCDIPEYQTKNFESLSKDDTEALAEAAAKKITQMMAECINVNIYGKNSDIFNLGRRINLKNSNFYESVINSKTLLSSIAAFDIETEVSIRRIGKIILEE